MMKKLLTFLILFTLSVGVGWSATSGSTTLNLTSEISFSDFSPIGGSYNSTEQKIDLTGSDNKAYVWSYTNVLNSSNNKNAQFKSSSSGGKFVSPTITSSYGFTVSVTYTGSGKLTIKIGDDSATGSTSSASLSTNLTSTSITIANNSSNAVYISEIKISPTASGGGWRCL